MTSPARADESEMVSRPNKRKFQFACNDDSDDEQMQDPPCLQRAASEDDHGLDIIDRFLRETAMENQTDQTIADDNARTHTTHQHDEASELFVPQGGEQHVSPSPALENAKVKPEPDLDDGFMIIEPTEASTDARERWAERRQPWTIDLTDDNPVQVKEESGLEHVKVKAEDPSGNHMPATSDSNASSAHIAELISKRDELKAKVLTGDHSPGDLDELLKFSAEIALQERKQETDKTKKDDV